MSSASDWYADEAALLQAVRVSGWSPPLQPDIPGYADWRELRRGGQGIVYSAIQRSTQRRVAVKLLLGGPIASREQRHRFEREIAVIARFQHPNIVRLYDRGVTDQGLPYYVMEQIDGCPLTEYLGLATPGSAPADAGSADPSAPTRALPAVADAVRLFLRVCAAAAYAHQHGVVHRDLKPGNILIDSSGDPHVLDFGLARYVRGESGPISTLASQAGDFLGTIPWASPEQATGQPDQVDARSDVYSLGVLLYQVLTGRLPYPANTVWEALRNIREAEPPLPSQTRAAIPAALDAIVLKCLAKLPEQRFHDAGALARDLAAFLKGEPVSARRSPWLHRAARRMRRQAGRWLIACLLLTAVLLVLREFWGGVVRRGGGRARSALPGRHAVLDAAGRCLATELFRLQPGDTGAMELFGSAVAIDGDTAVISASADGSVTPRGGSAYVYEFDGAHWVQRHKLYPSDAASALRFGTSVALERDTLVLGIPGGAAVQAAYVFAREGATWVEQARLSVPSESGGMRFACSLAVHGRTIVAAPYFGGQPDARVAYVYERTALPDGTGSSGVHWVEAAQLRVSGTPVRACASQTVALTGDWLVVATSISTGDVGGAYVFGRTTNRPADWVLAARLVPPASAPEDCFGYSVAAADDLIVVGAFADDTAGDESGAIHVFRFDGRAWRYEARLVPWDARGRERLGFTVAVRNGIVVGGAPGESQAGQLRGAAYVFEQVDGAWQGCAKLVAAEPDPVAMLATSLAFDGVTLLAGAPHQSDRGAAFIFAGLSDCDQSGVLDVCELVGGTTPDRNRNGRPDPCEPFGRRVVGNTTQCADDVFLGPPDDWTGILGTGTVEFDLGPSGVIDGPGPDLIVYELRGGAEAFSLIDVQIGDDGRTFASVKASETNAPDLPGAGVRGVAPSARRAYDLGSSGAPAARFVRVVGLRAKSPAGGDFDLDAIGVIHDSPNR